MKTFQIVLLVYGLLLLVGGWFGYHKAGSLPSLIAGGASGILALVALGVSFSRPALAMWGGGILAVLLAGVFILRLAKSGKLFPSGALLLASLAALALLAHALWRARARG